MPVKKIIHMEIFIAPLPWPLLDFRISSAKGVDFKIDKIVFLGIHNSEVK